MKFCKPIKPIELFTDEELTDAFSCGGQHQFAIEIFERWNKARAELAKAQEGLQKLRGLVYELDRVSEHNALCPVHSGKKCCCPRDGRDKHKQRSREAFSATLAAKGPTNE